MSGRARGRGAGRGRARNVDAEAVRRPGEDQNLTPETNTPQPVGRGRARSRGVEGRRAPAEISTNEIAGQLQHMSIENGNQSNQTNATIPGLGASHSTTEATSQRNAWSMKQPKQERCDAENLSSQQRAKYDEQGARPKTSTSSHGLESGGDDGDGNRPNHQNQTNYQQQGARPKQQSNVPHQSNENEVMNGQRSRGRPPPEIQSNHEQSRNGGDGDQQDVRNNQVRRFRPDTYTIKTGSSGQPLQIFSNALHFETTVLNWILYQYHVDFNPQVDSKKVRTAMLADHQDLLGDTRAFDGMILYMPRRLHQEVTEVYSVLRYSDTQVRITIQLVKELPPNDPECIKIYNVIFKRGLRSSGYEQNGRDYFNSENATKYPEHGIDIVPGFSAAIQRFEAENLVIVDVAHRLVQSKSVLEKMYKIYSMHNNDNDFWIDCLRRIPGSIVITKYNNKTYLIDDIEQDGRPYHTFELHNGEKITYVEYYMKHYGIKIDDMDQPLLISRPKKKDVRTGRRDPIKLVPELCFITGFTDEMKADFRMKAQVQSLTRVNPNQRVSRLREFAQNLMRNQEVQTMMNQWNLRISDNLMALQGRQLDRERIYQKNVEIVYDQNSCDWSKGMRNNPLTTAVNISNWIIIFWKRNLTEANDVIHALTRIGPPMGMNYRQPQRIELADDRNMSYISALRQNVTENTQLAMVILPSNNEDRYNAIKKFCCVEHPVPSQVVLKRTLSRKDQLLSVATKISMQLNCKLGGELWTTPMPNVKGGLMVIGMDIYHKRGQQSVGGFVCSLNQSCTRYSSGALFQMQKQEIMDGLSVKMTEGLKRYHAENGSLPAKIVIYRDGVGDGQLDMVMSHEVRQFQECFKEIGGYDPKFAVIIVKKRIGQRFFIRNGPSYDNPKPGTIVDTGVTKEEWADFFLVSQSVRQGTVSPTHYNIIHDSINIGADHLQKLTYKLCHLYYNWQGTIRVPAPCQYAHKLAYLVGQNLKRDPHPSLTDRLFFL